MPIVFLAGAGSDFMVLAPIARAFEACPDIDCKTVYTDRYQNGRRGRGFFDDMGLGDPDLILNAEGRPHARHTASVMTAFEVLCRDSSPDLVLVAGDGDPALGAALTASRLGIRVAHVEAGLRSFNRSRRPWEINGLAIDAVSDIFFVTEPQAMVNLKKEGKPGGAIHYVGQPLVDSLYYRLGRLGNIPKERLSSTRFKSRARDYGVVDVTRPDMVDDPERLAALMETLGRVSKRINLVFPILSGIRKNLTAFDIRPSPDIFFLPDLSHLAFLDLWKDASLVLTDSGRLQEETCALGIPCLTLADTTERSATVTLGTNELVGFSPEKILEHVDLAVSGQWKQGRRPDFWDGLSARRIVELIMIKTFRFN